MNSRKMKKLVLNVMVKLLPRNQFFRSKCKALEVPRRRPLSSLLRPHQLLSDSMIHNSEPKLSSVPKGFMAVYVGPRHRRFVIPTRLVSTPDFRDVMDMAAEEFGYSQQGGLRIPCDEHDFQELVSLCKFKSNNFQIFQHSCLPN